MSGFVATAPAQELPDLANDGWFPVVSLVHLRDVTRIDGTVTNERLREISRYAVLSVNRQLTTWRADRIAAGATSLAGVSPDEIDGTPRLHVIYLRAVHALAKADLIERYRDIDTTASGMRNAVDMEPAIDEHRRNASWAIREMQGLTRNVVELI